MLITVSSSAFIRLPVSSSAADEMFKVSKPMRKAEMAHYVLNAEQARDMSHVDDTHIA